MPALLSRVLGSVFGRRGPGCEPVPFGPRYSVGADGILAVESGPLAGARFRFDRQVENRKADFAWFPTDVATTDPVGHCHFDRDPDSGLETLWDIFIRNDYRHKGFSSVMVRASFRRLLESGRRHWFAMRKLMQVDTEAGRRHSVGLMNRLEDRARSLPHTTLHNVGIGVVALALGFRPEPGLAQMLSPRNVTSVRMLDTEPPDPPGLLLRLTGMPGVVVAAILDPATGKPAATRGFYERFVSPSNLLRQAMAGEALVGNIDYILARSGVEPLAGRLADNQSDASRISSMLRRGMPPDRRNN